MQKLYFYLTACLLFIICTTTTFATEPPNLQDAKTTVMKYHDSGEYTQDINHVVNNAITYLSARVTTNNAATNKKPAIVLDIDDTTLSNYERLKALNFGGDLALWHANKIPATDPAIPALLVLYNLAVKHNVAIFFVTGRHPYEQSITEQNLKNVGYTSWTNIYFKPENYSASHKNAAAFKTAMRKQITENGYDIIINIGDQESDLVGGYADKTFKVPNPFYRIL